MSPSSDKTIKKEVHCVPFFAGQDRLLCPGFLQVPHNLCLFEGGRVSGIDSLSCTEADAGSGGGERVAPLLPG